MTHTRTRLYIAGPYTAYHANGDPDTRTITANIHRARMASRKLLRLGFAVFAPHMNTAHFEQFAELQYEDFLETDLAWLQFADVVYMLRGWRESKGCEIEIEFCKAHGIPIIYEGAGNEYEILKGWVKWSHG